MRKLILAISLAALSAACTGPAIEHSIKTKPIGNEPLAQAEYQLRVTSKLEW